MNEKTTEETLEENATERTRCEVYSRIVGYLRPVSQWNAGKKSEFGDRMSYDCQKT